MSLRHPQSVQVTQGGDLIAEGKISVVHCKEPSKAAAAPGREAPVSEADALPEPPTPKAHPPVADLKAGPHPAQVSMFTDLPRCNTACAQGTAPLHRAIPMHLSCLKQRC